MSNFLKFVAVIALVLTGTMFFYPKFTGEGLASIETAAGGPEALHDETLLQTLNESLKRANKALEDANRAMENQVTFDTSLDNK